MHVSFYADLEIAQNVDETITVADCCLTRKDKFTVYGRFCSGLTQSQEALVKLCKDKPHFKEHVDILNVPLSFISLQHISVRKECLIQTVVLKNTVEHVVR